MAKKMFLIYHEYDVDGGYGDAVPCRDLLYIVDDETVAKDYVERFSNEYVYDRPYADLMAGKLVYEEYEDTFDPMRAPVGVFDGRGDEVLFGKLT